MQLIKKSLNRDEWKEILKKDVKVLLVQEEEFCGTVSLLTALEVSHRVVIKNLRGEVCVLDRGYQWLQLAPKNQNWWLTVLYDERQQQIDNYFDITRGNDFTDETNPTFIDLFLDVVFAKDGDPIILDEEELYEAFYENLITKEDVDFAFSVAKSIVEVYNRNKAGYALFIEKMLKKFQT